MSRLDFSERQESQNPSATDSASNSSSIDLSSPNAFYSMAIDNDILNCFVHLPPQEGHQFVLQYERIAQEQVRDAVLTQARNANPQRFQQLELSPGVNLWCFRRNHEDKWTIYLPNQLIGNAINWYHVALSHIGANRLYDTMSMVFYNPPY